MPPIFTRNQEVKGLFRAHDPARLEVGLREALQNERIDGTRVEPRSLHAGTDKAVDPFDVSDNLCASDHAVETAHVRWKNQHRWSPNSCRSAVDLLSVTVKLRVMRDHGCNVCHTDRGDVAT